MLFSLISLGFACLLQAPFSLRCLQGEVVLDESGIAAGMATLRVENPSGRIAYWLNPVISLANPAMDLAASFEPCRIPSGESIRLEVSLTQVKTVSGSAWEWQGCFALPRHPEQPANEPWEFVPAAIHWSATDGIRIEVGVHAPDCVRLGSSRSRLDGLEVEVEFFEHVGKPEMRFIYRNATTTDLYWTPNPEGCTFGGMEGPDRWRDQREQIDGMARARYGGVGCSPLHVDEPPTAEQIATWRMAPGEVRKDAGFWDAVHWRAADGLPYVDEPSRMIGWGRYIEVARPGTEPPATRGGWKETRAHLHWSLEQGGSLSYRRF